DLHRLFQPDRCDHAARPRHRRRRERRRAADRNTAGSALSRRRGDRRSSLRRVGRPALSPALAILAFGRARRFWPRSAACSHDRSSARPAALSQARNNRRRSALEPSMGDREMHSWGSRLLLGAAIVLIVPCASIAYSDWYAPESADNAATARAAATPTSDISVTVTVPPDSSFME